MSDDLPKGLYKGEDGVERYWNGSQWLEPQGASSRKTLPKKQIVLGGAVVLALAVAGLGVSSYLQQQTEAAVRDKFEQRAADVKSYFKTIVDGCGASEGVDFDDRNLTIDGEGEEDYSGATYSDVICIVMDAGMPPAVRSRFDSTNSLQGLLEDNWEVLNGDAEVVASWSYHPNSGPSVAMELKSIFFEPFDYELHKDLVDLENEPAVIEETP